MHLCGFRKTKRVLSIALLACLLNVLPGCGGRTEAASQEGYAAFSAEVDHFCDTIRLLDEKMNETASAEGGAEALLEYLDTLGAEFERFAALEFPEGCRSLEPAAGEAAEYMQRATGAFREAFTDETLSEDGIQAQYDYAAENYARAYKRIQAILEVLGTLSGSETE